MEPKTTMSLGERRRLDRQRFIGLQTQTKLLSSTILISPLTGPNTELAKNLVLAGVNITVYDSSIIRWSDFQTNFLIAYDEIGQQRGKVIFRRLQEMNPTGKNSYVQQMLDPSNSKKVSRQFLQQFTAVCTSELDFERVKKWDEVTKQANVPYYNQVCVGHFAFTYVSLGREYIYQQSPQKSNAKSYKIQCLSFSDCLNRSQVQKKTKKEYSCLQAILMMEDSQRKGLTYDIFDEQSQTNRDMLNCMVDLGEDIREVVDRSFLYSFARFFGVDYCPVYSVMGSIVSQQIIKVVENRQEPAVNWIVYDSQQGYATVVKMEEQAKNITSSPISADTPL